MKEMFASPTFGLIGLLLFFGVFVLILFRLYAPGGKEKFEKHAEIPLEDDKYE